MVLFQNCVWHSAVALLLKAALIQVSDYRLLEASGFIKFRHNFGRGPSNDYFIKVWFQTRRFLCEFPIGSYVKLSSAVGGHLGRRAEPPDLTKMAAQLYLV
jgi:hypothetical protein